MSLIDFFESLSPQEAEDFKDKFVESADGAIALFMSRLVEVTELSPADFDYSAESLTRVFEALLPWFASEADPYQWAGGPGPIWAEHSSMTRHQMWIVDGWIHYYARILERSGRLWWDWERDRDVATVNQPVLVGFRSNRRLAPISGSPSAVLVNAARKHRPEAIESSISAWLGRIPSPHEAPLPPEWFDGFAERDVDVLVAHPHRINDEAVWPHKPEDFAAAWRIDLVEGIDVVLGRGSTEQLLEHIQSQPGVEAAAHGDEDMLVVRAPTLSSQQVRSVILAWLNTKWAETKDRS